MGGHTLCAVNGGIEIVEATTAWHLEQVRTLLDEYRAWDVEVTRSLGLDVDRLGELFYAGVDDLPGRHARPQGRLLLALAGMDAAGCGGLRPLHPETGELARMFVRPAFRGRGVGRLLLEGLIREARAIGYRRLRLATGTFMTAAQAMYRAAGFRDIEPYIEMPDGFREITMYMELDLERTVN
jgi:GNAT superfamily N-acetyltransferase